MIMMVKSKRARMMLVGVSVLALGAGVAAGLLAARLPAAADTTAMPPAPDRTPLVEELQLTAAQRDQMQQIWEGVRDESRRAFEQAQQLQKRRDDALVALLNDEQKSRFERIAQDYAERFADLSRKRDESFHDAVERTKVLLSDGQRIKYEQILQKHVGARATITPIDLAPNRPNR